MNSFNNVINSNYGYNFGNTIKVKSVNNENRFGVVTGVNKSNINFDVNGTYTGSTIWEPTNGIYYWESIDMSLDGNYIAAVSDSYDLQISEDSGKSWRTQTVASLLWGTIRVSGDGKYMMCVPFSGNIFISSDYGYSWTSTATSSSWIGGSISYTGKYMLSGIDYGESAFISSDYGQTWTDIGILPYDWKGSSISSSGKYSIVCFTDGIAMSSNFGNTFETHVVLGDWKDVHVSASGKYILLSGAGEYAISSDFGGTWSITSLAGDWNRCSMSSSGRYMAMSTSPGVIITSDNFGSTWQTSSSPSSSWTSISMSGSGQAIVSCAYTDYIYMLSQSQLFFDCKDNYYIGFQNEIPIKGQSNLPYPVEYRLTFNGNGATSGSMPPQYIVRGTATPIADFAFSRTNYDFLYWVDSYNNIYYNGDLITITTHSSLTAIWEIIPPITITFSDGAPSGWPVLDPIIQNVGALFMPPDVTYTWEDGYHIMIFDGWIKLSDNSNVYPGTSYYPTEDWNLEPLWIVGGCVNCDGCDSPCDVSDESCYYCDAYIEYCILNCEAGDTCYGSCDDYDYG